MLESMGTVLLESMGTVLLDSPKGESERTVPADSISQKKAAA